jgi:hypothetical protein
MHAGDEMAWGSAQSVHTDALGQGVDVKNMFPDGFPGNKEGLGRNILPTDGVNDSGKPVPRKTPFPLG